MGVRWGVLGPGRIAENVLTDAARHLDGGEFVAVASRSQERADDVAARHGIARAYDSYEALLADPEVDAVYVTTPHSLHAAHGVAVLEAGKALLMEKAFTATLPGAKRVVDTARERGVFAMEAMWTRFQPAILALRERIADGAIGEVRGVQVDLGVRRPFDPADRLFALGLGGGTLLDLGVYTVSFAQMLLGDPRRVVAAGALLPTGVDGESALLLDYGDGRSASLTSSFRSPTPGTARVFGTDGWIEVPPRFHHPDRIVLHPHGAEPETVLAPPRGVGYAHEFDEVHAALAAGRTESAVMPLADTLAVQAILQEAADQLGVALREER